MNTKYLKEVREKALEVAALSHTGLEAKEVIKDLVNITEQVESMVTDRVSDGADQRVLQKRYDALKIEHRDALKKLEDIRSTMTTKLAIIIKSLNADVAQIADAQCAGKIKASIKQMIDLITKL